MKSIWSYVIKYKYAKLPKPIVNQIALIIQQLRNTKF